MWALVYVDLLCFFSSACPFRPPAWKYLDVLDILPQYQVRATIPAADGLRVREPSLLDVDKDAARCNPYRVGGFLASDVVVYVHIT